MKSGCFRAFTLHATLYYHTASNLISSIFRRRLLFSWLGPKKEMAEAAVIRSNEKVKCAWRKSSSSCVIEQSATPGEINIGEISRRVVSACMRRMACETRSWQLRRGSNK